MGLFSISKDYSMGPITQTFWRLAFGISIGGFFRAKVFGREHLPQGGAAIIAPNHSSYADPPLIGYAVQRPTYFMAKAELFRNPAFAFLIRWLGAFPVQRQGVDKVAIRRSMDILKRGDFLGIFPQGGRRREGTFDKLHDGVASLALRTGSPIVPVAIIGAEKMKPGKVVVNIGKPIVVKKGKPTAEAIAAINNQLSETLRTLYEEKAYLVR